MPLQGPFPSSGQYLPLRFGAFVGNGALRDYYPLNTWAPSTRVKQEECEADQLPATSIVD